MNPNDNNNNQTTKWNGKIFTKNAKCYDQWKMFISESFELFFSQCLNALRKKDSLYPLFDFLRSMFLLIKSSYSLFIEIT
jgi:hypothetical protein